MPRNNNNQAPAVIAPPRMKMPAHIEKEYGVGEDSWRALTDAVFPSAKSVGAVVLALAYCKRHKLDVFQRVVHIVPIYSNGKTMESVWPGIGLLRVIAQRQGDFAGYDDCEFGPLIEKEFAGEADVWSDAGNGNRQKRVEKVTATVTYPEWAQFTVYKQINGQRVKMPGPKVWFEETYAWKSGKCAVPNEMWCKRPRGQLEKCAEAAALRRAFPDVLGNEYAMEEMEGRNVEEPIEGTYVEVESSRTRQASAPKQKPKRSDYQERSADKEPEDETAILDTEDMPSNESQWDRAVELFGVRIERCEDLGALGEFQHAQKFRIDKAPPKHADQIAELFRARFAALDEAGKADYDGDTETEEGADNETQGD